MKKRVELKKFNKGFGLWNTMPEGMIVKCAEADALRASFPTMLGGLMLREEVEATMVEVEPFVPRRTKLAPSASAAVNVDNLKPADAAQAQPAQTQTPARKKKEAQPEPVPKEPEPTPTPQPPTEPLEGDAALLKAWCDENQIPEVVVCQFICEKYHLSPCEQLSVVYEIAPRRVSMLYADREKHLGELKDSIPT